MKEELQEYIASYWNQELSKEENQIFERRCATDEAFAREVALFKHLQHIAKENHKKQLQDSYFQEQKQQQKRRLLMIGGIIVFVLVAFLLLKWGSSPAKSLNTPEKIYAQLKPTFNNVRDNSTDSSAILLQFYNNQQYDTLINLATQKEINQPQNLDWLILKTLSDYGKGNYSQVIQDINSYQKNNPNNANEAGKLLWIQALAHWKNNNIIEAKKNWTIIIEEDYRPYSIQAQELLNNQ